MLRARNKNFGLLSTFRVIINKFIRSVLSYIFKLDKCIDITTHMFRDLFKFQIKKLFVNYKKLLF